MPRPYVIVSHDYTRKSAGVRALHELAYQLHKYVTDAYITGKPGPRTYNNYADEDLLRELIRDGIVVYPEVEDGNPLGAKRIVRYFLNKPGRIRKAEFTPGEVRFAYCGLLNEYINCDPKRILTVPVVDTSLFNSSFAMPWHSREKSAYWAGAKCADNPVELRPETKNMTEITFQWPETWLDLAALFRECKWFFSYQNYTAMLTEARLCGCPCVVIPNGLWSRGEYEAGVPYGMSGLAWGTDLDELIRARDTVDDFWDDHDIIRSDFESQIDNFVHITQEAFK